MHTRIDKVTQTFHIHEIFIDLDVKINFLFIETFFSLNYIIVLLSFRYIIRVHVYSDLSGTEPR